MLWSFQKLDAAGLETLARRNERGICAQADQTRRKSNEKSESNTVPRHGRSRRLRQASADSGHGHPSTAVAESAANTRGLSEDPVCGAAQRLLSEPRFRGRGARTPRARHPSRRRTPGLGVWRTADRRYARHDIRQRDSWTRGGSRSGVALPARQDPIRPRYLRYLDPMYSRSSGLRLRAHERTPAGMLRLSRLRLFGLRPARRLVSHALDAIDRAVPPCQAIEQYLDEHRPDLVVITPLVGLVASSQLDLLRSALQRRIATAVVVGAGTICRARRSSATCQMLSWCGTRSRNRRRSISIAFQRPASLSRWAVLRPLVRPGADALPSSVLPSRRVPDDRPFVLWACSALLPGSPPEPTVVMRWASHLRA